MRLLLSACVLALTSGCLGTELLEELETQTDDQRIQAIIDEGSAIGDRIDDSFAGALQPVATRADLPLGGSANFTGAAVALIGTGAVEDSNVVAGALGDLDVTLQFQSGVLSGGITDFLTLAEPGDVDFDSDDLGLTPTSSGAATGSLTIAGSGYNAIVPGGVDITINGRIDGADGSFIDIVSLAGGGFLFGDNEEVLLIEAEYDNTTVDDVTGFVTVLGFGSQ